jgi:hypothetical protein
MPETEPSKDQLDSGWQGCFPLLIPFVLVIGIIVLILLGFVVWGKISP